MLAVQPLAPTAGPEARSEPEPLAAAIAGVATGFARTLDAAEAASVGAMAGDVGLREAVDAVMEAERSLRTAAAIRDKLVAGWLDLSRMSI